MVSFKKPKGCLVVIDMHACMQEERPDLSKPAAK